MSKNLVSRPILTRLAQIQTANFFFFKSLSSSVNDRRMEGQTDKPTDRHTRMISQDAVQLTSRAQE